MKSLGSAAIAVAALTLSIAACGSDQPADTSSAPGKPTTFVLDEWSVVPPKSDLPAGKVAISATNNGNETHELVIVRASDADTLPKKEDGSVDEDKIPESKKVGEIADLTAQETKTTTLDLSAGDYIAFCNLVEDMGMGTGSDSGMGTGGGMGGAGMEHVHFELGMVNHFTVA